MIDQSTIEKILDVAVIKDIKKAKRTAIFIKPPHPSHKFIIIENFF